jgi:hypothetical protein
MDFFSAAARALSWYQRPRLPDLELGEPTPYYPQENLRDEETWHIYDLEGVCDLIEVVIDDGRRCHASHASHASYTSYN